MRDKLLHLIERCALAVANWCWVHRSAGAAAYRRRINGFAKD